MKLGLEVLAGAVEESLSSKTFVVLKVCGVFRVVHETFGELF